MLDAAPYRALLAWSMLVAPLLLGTAQARADPWVGDWETSSKDLNLSASIRHGTAKPDFLAIDLTTGVEGCSGSVTVYGKPSGRTVIGKSYDPKDPNAPTCTVTLSLGAKGRLSAKEGDNCSYFHGASCGFDGSMARSK